VSINAPTDVPNCIAWFNASAITGKNDGDPVTTWFDLSGKGHDITQAMAGFRPVWKSHVLTMKAMPTVRFDGVDDVLASPVNIYPHVTDITMFVVFNPTVLASWDIMGEGTPGNSNSPGAQVNRFYGNVGPVTLGGGDQIDYRNFVTAGGVNMLTYRNTKATTTGEAWINGVRRAFNGGVTQNGTIDNATASPFYIGLGTERGGAFPGDIAEAIVYSRSLTDAERLDVEGYLSARYLPDTIAPSSEADGISFIGTHMYRKRKVF